MHLGNHKHCMKLMIIPGLIRSSGFIFQDEYNGFRIIYFCFFLNYV